MIGTKVMAGVMFASSAIGSSARVRCGAPAGSCEVDEEPQPAAPHLNQAALLRPMPDGVTDLDHFGVKRRDRAGSVIHEYRLVA
jgi:hypothetical protein